MNKKNDRKDFHDSTTDFFLKVVQREKEYRSKEFHTKDNVNLAKSKTVDKVSVFYNYINQVIDKILSSRLSVMFLSLIIAAILFISISGGEVWSSPAAGTTLENVPVVVEGLDSQYELSGIPESVEVGLIGPSLDIYTTRLSKNYEVYVDLSEVSEGEHIVELKTRNFPDTLDVMLVPDTLKIKLAPKESQTFDLGYRFINEDELDAQYSISVESMAVNKVTIRASRETLDKIVKVDAGIDVANKTEAFTQDARIKAYDSMGNEISVDIAPTTVNVECNVASYSQTATVKANFVGELASGYQISNYALSQSTVKIYGLKEDIQDISVVYVDVNVQDLNKSTVIENLSLKKETGVNKFSIDEISVTLDIDKVITKSFDNIPIKVLNNDKKNKVSFAGKGDKAIVSITGSEKKVSSLTADNIQATIDVNKLDVGTHKVNVKVAVDDDDLTIHLLSSSKITINIERK